MKIDEKDEKILNELEKDARTSYAKIAKKLSLSEAAIRKRIKKLEEKEIICGYHAKINYKKLGFSNKVIVGVDTTPSEYLNVINSLKNQEFVKNLSTSSGDHMIVFELYIRDLSELEIYLALINQFEGVIKTCPSIIHEEF